MSYLFNFEAINGGYVAFGGNSKGGKITGKGKIRIGKLDFDDVYFIKELRFNLFSVSQMCDKKNSVLFTDTECIVLSFDFKMPDESHATLDESNLWHRRLGYINFKTMNKLVKGIKMEFSVARTPQQNGIAERKNMALIEAARTMLADSLLPIPFWAEAVNTACFMRPFGCLVTILNTLDPLGKFDGKADEVFLVGYSHESEVHVSPSSSAKTKKHDDKTNREAKGKSLVELSIGVRNLSEEFEDFTDNSTNEVNAASTPVTAVEPNSTNSTNTFNADGPSNNVVSSNFKIGGKSSFVDPSQYPDDPDMSALEDITYSDDEEDVGVEADFSNLETNIISMKRMATDQGGLTQINNDDFHTCMFACFLSQEEPKRVHQALKDPSWIEAMQEELLQFKMQKFWVLVDMTKGKRAIGHTQEKGIDYEEVFAPVARIEAIRLILAYASFMGFMVSQMDVKSAFLYGTIEEDVYVCQPPGFKDLDYPDKVYVDDIIFGSTNKDLCKAFEKLMKDKFQMSSMGELTFFLGLQVKQKKDRIFIIHDKYVAEILRKFGLTDGKSASTSIDTEKPLLKDPDGENVDVHTYRSIIGSLMYLTSSRQDIMFATNDVVRLQALIDRKKVIIIEDTVREALRLDDAKSIDCLPNKEIFAELQRMGRKFNFSKYIFDSLVRNVDSSLKFYMVRKGFSQVDTPLFEGMLVPQQVADEVAAGVDEAASIQGGKIAKIDADEDVILEEVDINVDEENDDEPELAELDVVEVVTTAKLMTEVVTAAATITAVTTAASTITDAPSAARRRKGVVIRDPEETATPSTIVHFEPKSKDKGKGILVEEPKPLKKQAQIEQDEAYARELQAELNKNINWDDVIEQVKDKGKLDNAVLRYQALKRKPQTEAQAKKNIIVYLKNMAGFKMDFFRAKKQKLDEEVEELKKHLQIVPNDEDDVYTEATPLALKIVQERFASSKPNNFSDDFLLTILKAMFEKPNVEAQMWKSQRGIHGLAKVKSWKLLESYRPKSKRKKQLPRSKCKKKIPSRSNCQVWIASNEKYLQSKAEKEAKQKRKREEKKSPGRWTRSDETKLLAEKHKRMKKQQADYQQTTKNEDKGKEEVVDVEQQSDMNERLKKQKQAETKKKSRTKEKRRRAAMRLLFEAMCGLTPQRKRVVREMGFGNLIDFPIVEIPTKLAFYVVDILNTRKKTLECPMGDIVITPKTVKEVLGLPMGIRKLEREGQREYNDPFLEEWKDQMCKCVESKTKKKGCCLLWASDVLDEPNIPEYHSSSSIEYDDDDDDNSQIGDYNENNYRTQTDSVEEDHVQIVQKLNKRKETTCNTPMKKTIKSAEKKKDQTNDVGWESILENEEEIIRKGREYSTEQRKKAQQHERERKRKRKKEKDQIGSSSQESPVFGKDNSLLGSQPIFDLGARPTYEKIKILSEKKKKMGLKSKYVNKTVDPSVEFTKNEKLLGRSIFSTQEEEE
nr:ribonuclease H-like domain, reverse transcriptase, RNA-dependent DNA polymerase [Tanacetum cinerariifolium]